LALLDWGLSLNEVGRRMGCNASSVMRWRDARRRGGAKALRVRFSPGRPWKLDAATKALDGWAAGRTDRAWLPNQAVDHKPHGRGDPGQVRSPLSPRPGRSVDAQLEKKVERWKEKNWARVKKTLHGWAPLSYLPMNRASS
jgi:hypothetical protein